MKLIASFVFGMIVVVATAFGVAAKVPDNGPPYSDAQFLAISDERTPEGARAQLHAWWARAPEYLRKHVLSSPSDRWPGIIKCNYMGFRPDVEGPMNSKKCEDEDYAGVQRGKKMWTADGQWIGPSEECIRRDKRSKYGELVCD
ncbi:MAG: hypothetical protein ABL973_01930 [Micropepsaceae bacterium]